MKKRLVAALSVTLTLAFVTTTLAKPEKENCPKKKEVEKILKEIGEDHFPERMKVNEVGSLEMGDTYLHVFCGYKKKGGYRIIFFNNKPEYMGYYESDYEAIGYGEGEIELDSGDGETTYTLPIPSKGPASRVTIGDNQASFKKNPKLEEEAKAAGGSGEVKLVVPEKQKSESGEVIDYRDWTITMQGKQITVNAIFVKIDGNKIVIKNAKNGKEAAIPGSALSAEDQEYVKRITAK